MIVDQYFEHTSYKNLKLVQATPAVLMALREPVQSPGERRPALSNNLLFRSTGSGGATVHTHRSRSECAVRRTRGRLQDLEARPPGEGAEPRLTRRRPGVRAGGRGAEAVCWCCLSSVIKGASRPPGHLESGNVPSSDPMTVLARGVSKLPGGELSVGKGRLHAACLPASTTGDEAAVATLKPKAKGPRARPTDTTTPAPTPTRADPLRATRTARSSH